MPEKCFLKDTEISSTEYYFLCAMLGAERSKDPCTQVGACIIDGDGNLLGVGYNGMPRGCNDDEVPWGKSSDDPLENKYYYVCHAEMNAIANSIGNLSGSTMYVTLFPCNECSKLIIQHGIKNIVYLSDKHAHKSSTIASKFMFDKAQVSYRHFKSKREFIIEFPTGESEGIVEAKPKDLGELAECVEKLKIN